MIVYSEDQARRDLTAVLEEATANGAVRIRRGDGQEFLLKPVVSPSASSNQLCPQKQRDLSDLAGTWVEDPGFDEAMSDQDRVDPDMWKWEGAEMNLAIDTNRYTDFQRGIPDVVHTLEHAAAVFLPLNVLAELRAGFLHGTRPAENERNLSNFLTRQGIQILLPDEATTHHYASLYQQLRKQATPIPTNDLWIAALVVQHGLTLYSRDTHFDHLPQIPRL
jgi:tRNA(fMet)-specific endonuclease VapC